MLGTQSKPRHRGGVRTPILLVIPLMVWTLSGGQTRFRLWRHSYILKHRNRPLKPGPAKRKNPSTFLIS